MLPRPASMTPARSLTRAAVTALLTAALVLAGIVLPVLPVTAAHAAATPNPIVLENQNPGTTAWKIAQAGYLAADDTNRQIEGYVSTTSVNKGESLDFMVSVNTPQTFTADVYRLGYYGGKGGRFMAHVGPLNATTQAACPPDATTGLTQCAWTPSFSYTVPTTWTSGIYLVLLTNAAKYQRYMTFVVRDDARPSDLLFQQAVTTYQAYNIWPVGTGKSLYDFNSAAPTTPATGGKRAASVTFDRPYDDGFGAGQLIEPAWGWERYHLMFLEQNGYDVSYSTDLDTHTDGARLLNHKGFVSVGHDEYWSRQMYDHVAAARDAGVNLGFFGSNTAYWQVRFGASPSGRENRVMTCYKSAAKDPVKDPTLTGVLFRDAPSSTAEQQLVGVQYTSHVMNEGAGTDYIVKNADNWVWAGTGVSEGTAIPGILGYETDRYMTEYPPPNALSHTLLADTPVTDAAGVPGRQNTSIYQAASGAWVFGSGTNHWSYGLGKPGVADLRIQQATKNILNKLINFVPPPPSAPSAPAVLTATPFSSTVIDLAWQDTADNELGYTVERSADGGATWTALKTGLPAGSTSLRDAAATGGVTYTYRVKATNDIGDSAFAVSAAVTSPPVTSAVFTDSFTGTTGAPWAATKWNGYGTAASVADIQDNGGRLGIGNVAGDYYQTTATMTPTVDTETLLSFRTTTTGPRAYLYVFGRGSGVWKSGYPTGSYFAQLTNDGAAVSIWKSVAGVTTQLAVNNTAGAVTTTKQWMRLRVEGTSIKVKVWTDGTAEPTAWEVTTTDTAVTAPGVLQAKIYRSGSSTAPRDIILDDIVVNTLAPVPTPPTAPTGLTASTGSSSAIDLAWTDTATNETAYTVERSTDGVLWTVLTATLPANSTGYRDAGLAAGVSYRYRVRATNTAGSSTVSNVAVGATGTVPAAPTGLAVTARMSEAITLAWTDHATNETAYYVERQPQGTTDWSVVDLPAGTTTYTDSGLATSTTYNYRVRASNAVGDSAYSATVSATTLPPPLQPPVAPSGLAATAVSTTAIALTWVDAAGNETGYTVQRSADDGATWADAATLPDGSTAWSDSGLTPETTYTYRVRAINDAGPSGWSATASATTQRPPQPPAAPSDLSATAISRTDIDLAWVDHATTESGYRVERSTDGGTTWALAATLPAGATGYRDSGLTAATAYSYRVLALNEVGPSTPSNTATATTQPPLPSAPTGLTATTVSTSAIDLTWTDTSSSETAYSVERSADGGQTWLIAASLPANATSTRDSGLEPGTTYTYRVRAGSATDWSAYSATATGATLAAPPAAPSGLSAMVVSATAVDLAWVDEAPTETIYAVQRSADQGATWVSVAADLPADTVSYSDHGLTPSTQYQYRVRATNAAGASDWAGPVTVTTPAVPLATPTGLQASVVSGTAVDLTWVDAASDEIAYAVERSTDGGDTWQTLTASLPAGSTTYRVSGLTEGTTYSFRVRAGNAAGWSASSTVATATTPVSAPQAPTGLAATAVSSSAVDLTWVDAATQETGYLVERSVNGGTWLPLATLAADAVAYHDADVSAQTLYAYRVAATNAGGNSAWVQTSVMTPAAPVPAPAAPTGLGGVAGSPTSIALTWVDAASNETAYVIERSADGGATWVSLTSTLPADSTGYADTQVVEGSTYTYRVRATNAGGDSAWATTTVTTPLAPPPAPAAPTGLSATAGSPTTVALAWTDAASNETAYVVQRSADAGATWSTLTSTLTADATSYADSGLTGDTAYSYRVRATNAGGDSAWATATVRTPVAAPAAPTGLSATAGSPTTVALAWTDAASNETAYVVQRSADAGATWSTLTSTLTADTTGYTDSTAAAATAYTYRVRATNAGGDSAWATATVTTPAAPPAVPAAPTGLAATSPTPTSVALTWTDAASDETAYGVERSADAGATWTSLSTTLPAGSTTYTDTTASSAKTYTYRVRATNAGGASAWATVTVTTRTLLFSDTFTGANGSAWANTKWTGLVGTGAWDIQNNGGRMKVSTDTNDRVQVNSIMTASADSETLMSFQWTSTGPRAYLYLFGRASGSWVSGYPASAYFVQMTSDANKVQFYKVVNGATTALGQNLAIAENSTAKQWLRMRIVGSTLQARIWTDGTPEPTTWELNVTDTSITTAGDFRARLWRSAAGTATREVILDDLLVMR